MEVKNYAHCAFMAPDPKLITIDLSEVTKRVNAHNRAMEKLNPPKPEPVRVEYNRLRQRFFDLQQQAKGTEINCNEKAGVVHLLEQRINDLLRQKKTAIDQGNLGQERACEHKIQLLETELVTAKEDFTIAKHRSSKAARALREFDGDERIAELKKQLDGTVLPVAKTHNRTE